ncbi:hypothetical protein ACFOLC_15635 [Lysobacter cavernae]|uniref:Tetratricopeptide repeat protein n=1 Tax=Lysobacter cavernae TaxID=1685901 RepID=A0ABV7RV14_9GAMM
MSAAKSPVEQRIDLLRDLWLEATGDEQARLLVWRIPGNADRMLAAFFEAHRQAEEAMTPDFFLNFDCDFDTGFGYSRALLEHFQLGYVGSRDSLKAQGAAIDWRGAHADHPSSAAGVMDMLGSFAQHYREHMRSFVAVLVPGAVTSVEALQRWLETALQAPVPERVRLCVVDYADSRQWQPLVERFGKSVRVIDAPIDMFDIARATAAQSSGGAGPTSAYRQMLTDVMTLLDKGSAAQTAARAERALQMAGRQQWPDQQVVLHMAVAGAHLKEKQFPEAITRYRSARECALVAETVQHAAGTHLVMQTWFGEAGVWLTAGQPERAAQAYAQGAEVARRVPNGMFAIEGQRMAGFCLARAGQPEPARDRYLQGLGEAKAMLPADRAMTTLPLLLQDMLRLQDATRTEKLEHCAKVYQDEIAQAHQQAETRAAALGARPPASAITALEAEMGATFERSFRKVCDERERLVAGGDEFFRKVVAIGRDFLHPAWNGLPDVKHPLDKEQPEWDAPPQFAQLPDPSDLLVDDAGGRNRPIPTDTVESIV